MSKVSTNVCVFSGSLGKDAKQGVSQNGKDWLNFSIAVNIYKQEQAMWVGCMMFGQRVEVLAPYLKKGVRVLVSGKLEMKEYEGRMTPSLSVSEIEILSPKKGDAEQAEDNSYDPTPPKAAATTRGKFAPARDHYVAVPPQPEYAPAGQVLRDIQESMKKRLPGDTAAFEELKTKMRGFSKRAEEAADEAVDDSGYAQPPIEDGFETVPF